MKRTLLLLLLAGCGSQQIDVKNQYTVEESRVNCTFDVTARYGKVRKLLDLHLAACGQPAGTVAKK